MAIKMKAKIMILALFFLIVLAFSGIASAQAANTFLSVSLIVAFLGGFISILSPCSVAVFPAFFAYALEGKKELVKMTFLFFLGLSVILVPIGFAASTFGQFLTAYRVQIITIAGIGMIIFGILALFGKGFSMFGKFIQPAQRKGSRNFNTFVFGILFGTGFTPCAGPILGAILTLAAASPTAFTGGFLFFVYALGIVAPLFILSYFFERLHLDRAKWMYAGFDLKLFGYEHRFHWTNITSGLIFMGLGFLFVYFRGTAFLNSLFARLNLLDPFFNSQDLILQYFNNIPNYVAIGVIVAVLAYLGYKFLRIKK